MRVVALLAAVAAGAGLLPAYAQQAPAAPAPSVVDAGATPAADPATPKPEAPVTTVAKPDAAAAKPKPPGPPAVIARIDLSAQRLDVRVGGEHRYSWAISSGREGYATPRGVFRPQWTARMWYSRKYDMAPMPYAVFFNGGVAVHATSATGLLGRPASHGCVRLAPANAATFYALVHKHGLRNVRIEVFGTARAPHVASRRQRTVHASAGRRLDRGVSVGVTAANGRIQRSANVRHPGMIHLPAGHPYKGRDSFELNGIRYVRVR